MRSLKVLENVLHEMIAACQKVYPNEACGLLGGRQDLAFSHYPLQNVAASPIDSFLGDRDDHIAAVRQMEFRGESLVAIYHSHPKTAPVPSREDIEQATYPKTPYVIVSLAEWWRPRMRAFLLDPGRMRSVEIHWFVVR